MHLMRTRLAGDTAVPNKVKYADVRPRPKPKSKERSKPQPLPGGFATVSTLSDTQTASVVGVFVALGAWSLLQGLTEPNALAAANSIPGLQLALGTGSAIYILRDRKKVGLGRAVAITGAGLLLGTLVGGAVQSWLHVEMLPLWVGWKGGRVEWRVGLVAGPEETGFGAYLRDLSVGVPTHGVPAPQTFEETSFEAYLRAAAFKSQDHAEAGSASGEAESAPPTARPVTIVFGTEYGFSKEIAERLADRLREAGEGYWPVVLDMADHAEGVPPLTKQQALAVVCSTQGDGVPPAEARGFCAWLASLEAAEFKGVPFSVCALGDTTYTHFCRCGRSIDAWLESAGGTRFAPRAEINREDYAAVDAWIDAVISSLGTLDLRTVEELEGSDALAFLSPELGSGQTKRKGWSRNRPYLATVSAVEGLCALRGPDDKNTVRVEISLGESGLQYLPGDALGVWPSNDPQALEDLVLALGAKGDLLVQVPKWHYTDPRLPEGATSMTLRDALTRCYDLRQPRTELFALLRDSLQGKPGCGTDGSSCGGDAADGSAACVVGCLADKLDLLAGFLGDAERAEAYLAPRHVIDVLADFRPARPRPADVLGTLRQLAPRLYSISSSQLEGAAGVQATVAVVRYESLGAERLGVASTDLAERLGPGAALPIYIHTNPDFRLPSDPSKPIVMVGPGTGLAPFRSFLMERRLLAKPSVGALGEALLFFGCRRRDQDYLYGSQLEAWAQEGSIQLFTAFSREDPEKKVYVQQRLVEAGAMVWAALQAGGHFYVCGDAAAMAGQVEEALLGVIAQHSARTPQEARQVLDGMTREGRYQRDVWF
ncbi:NADPH oxidoreductase A [Auxenochlorella protothecoides]|uniref:NADPH oxidoreductase A n=1 Tax=Auxenochlorella protothecoides TaxID=3075 RepID=A0A087SDP8_AUXPR|nr:NADPH oxidoreductase A [Auxenochlorella protothecoides]KFM23852.1 NADPH oxidoreductase A [Auxenochlorella protothecoides]